MQEKGVFISDFGFRNWEICFSKLLNYMFEFSEIRILYVFNLYQCGKMVQPEKISLPPLAGSQFPSLPASPFNRRKAGIFFENCYKAAGGFISYYPADLFDRLIGLLKQFPRFFHTCIDEIFINADAIYLSEFLFQGIGIRARFQCNLFNRKMFPDIRFNDRCCFYKPARSM